MGFGELREKKGSDLWERRPRRDSLDMEKNCRVGGARLGTATPITAPDLKRVADVERMRTGGRNPRGLNLLRPLRE